MTLEIDAQSLLVAVPGAATLASIERELAPSGLTLGLPVSDTTVADWLAAGAPGSPSSFADPADHLVAGLTATLVDGSRLEVRPSPRRSVGPDLIALLVGAGERFGTIEQAWLRIHKKDARRVSRSTEGLELDAPISAGEEQLLARIHAELNRR
jgi:alkyldihydroxyacetonephosphate synthase